MHLLKQTTITFHKYTIYYYLHLALFLLFSFFFKFHLTFPDQELTPLDISVNSCLALTALTLPGLGGVGPVVQLLGVLPSTKSRLPP